MKVGGGRWGVLSTLSSRYSGLLRGVWKGGTFSVHQHSKVRRGTDVRSDDVTSAPLCMSPYYLLRVHVLMSRGHGRPLIVCHYGSDRFDWDITLSLHPHQSPFTPNYIPGPGNLGWSLECETLISPSLSGHWSRGMCVRDELWVPYTNDPVHFH